MSEMNDRLKEISDKMDEHILAVKGTLELVDASVTEEDLHSLIIKAVERMDNLQILSDELFVALKQLVAKISETKESPEP